MDRLWLILYLLTGGAAIVQATLMLLQTWENRRFARNRIGEWPPPQPVGHAVVFAPCKGLDVGLEQNLRALMTQDYDNYQVRFVVGGSDDPVCPLLRRIMAEFPRVPARLVVAGAASQSGQKVHNLRMATADLPPRTEYLAFVDSDARPRPQWLRSLICRLDQPRAGAATGYRWFVPDRPSLANHMLYSINCSVGLMLGHGGRHLIWGGSWAIRREVFDQVGIREAWRGMLTDDLVATQRLTSRRLKILFEPACMVVSPLEQNLTDAFRFMRRQYFITHWYAFGPWLLLLLAATLVQLTWAASVAGLLWGLRGGALSPLVPVAVMTVLYGLGVARAWLRQDLGKAYFPHLTSYLAAARRFDLWAGPLVGLLQWFGLLSSLIGRRMTWRGIQYELGPGGVVRRLHLAHDQAVPPPAAAPSPVPAGAGRHLPDARPVSSDR